MMCGRPASRRSPAAHKTLGHGVLGLLATLGALWAHPIHISIAEVDWNSDTCNLEIALKVWSADLEEALEAQAKRPLDLEREPDFETLTASYLSERFQVTDGNGESAQPKLLGVELELKDAWLYFEVPLAQPAQAKLQNSFFFELSDEQVNTLLVGRGDERTSIDLSLKRPVASLGHEYSCSR